MKNINIRLYNELDYKDILDFELHHHQSDFTTLPIKIIKEAINNKNSFPFVIENRVGSLVGFFLIHKFYQHEGFSTPIDSTFIRFVNINLKYQGNGYGTMLFQYLPKIIQENLIDVNHLYLVVDEVNKVALKLYENAGFNHIATKKDGPIGPELLYYLDLNYT